METLVRQSQVAAWLAARFPQPTPEVTEAMEYLVEQADKGVTYLVSDFLDVDLTTVRDELVDQARPYADTGALLLDEQGPKDWRSKIDVEILDIADGTDCILGQLYNGWENGLDALFYGPAGAETEEERRALRAELSTSQWMGNRGFDRGEQPQYRGITLAWRELLTATVPA